jgi:hypothetical protein
MSDTDPRINAARFEDTLPGVANRRAQRRYSFQAGVEVLPLDGRGTRIKGSTSDISHLGIFINAEEQPAIDTVVVLKIQSELGTLQPSARVVHRLRGIGFGCEFADLTEDQRHTLSEWVRLTSAAVLGSESSAERGDPGH